MNATTYVAYAFIAVAFVSFFVMATVAYGQFVLRAWRPMFMSLAVILILLAIMRKATDIINAERAQQAIEQQSPFSK
jgi:hypothetical protein